jgi:hypothetical protein
MLSFKQYLQQPTTDRRSPKSKSRTGSQQSPLEEAKSAERSELRLMNRWELIRLIAEGPIEMVEVAIESEGIFFQFVEFED